MKKGDVNKGIYIHITMLLLIWTKVLNVMLFHGPLPLELNRDLQQWMLYITLIKSDSKYLQYNVTNDFNIDIKKCFFSIKSVY